MNDEEGDGLELSRRELGAAAAGIAGASGLGFLGYRRLTGEETDADEGPMNPSSIVTDRD